MSAIDPKTLDEKIEALAVRIAEDLAEGKKVNKDKIDAFRALSAYFAATRKLGIKGEDEDNPGDTIANFRARIDKTSSAN